MLLDASDRFIADGRIEAAMAAWNAVCAGKSAHCHALEPGEGLGVGFDPEIGGRGFSWHMPRMAGVSGTLQPDVATVNFSGTESDQVETLWRMIPVKSSAKYALDFEYQTRDIAPGSGLVWQVTSVAGARPKALAASPHLSKFGWTRESLSFSTDPEVHLVRVSLAYSRPPGQVHIKGTVFTRAVAVRPTT